MNDERWVRRSHSMSPTVAGLTPIVSHNARLKAPRLYSLYRNQFERIGCLCYVDGETHTEPVTRNMDTGYTARVRPHARASRRSKL